MRSHLGPSLDQHVNTLVSAPQAGNVQRCLADSVCHRWIHAIVDELLDRVRLAALSLCTRSMRLQNARLCVSVLWYRQLLSDAASGLHG